MDERDFATHTENPPWGGKITFIHVLPSIQKLYVFACHETETAALCGANLPSEIWICMRFTCGLRGSMAQVTPSFGGLVYGLAVDPHLSKSSWGASAIMTLRISSLRGLEALSDLKNAIASSLGRWSSPQGFDPSTQGFDPSTQGFDASTTPKGSFS